MPVTTVESTSYSTLRFFILKLSPEGEVDTLTSSRHGSS